jgi:hypothetical protein
MPALTSVHAIYTLMPFAETRVHRRTNRHPYKRKNRSRQLDANESNILDGL